MGLALSALLLRLATGLWQTQRAEQVATQAARLLTRIPQAPYSASHPRPDAERVSLTAGRRNHAAT